MFFGYIDWMYNLFYFFFFQAEDGIRDHCVTGVQTCALPISTTRRVKVPKLPVVVNISWLTYLWRVYRCIRRSEERRVGKECRSRWSLCNKKKKKRNAAKDEIQ